MSTTSRPAPQSSRLSSPASKRNFLAEIQTDVAKRPTASILYGVPGIGKTSMAAHATGVIFVTARGEDGITTLKNFGQVPLSVPQMPPAKNWSDVLAMLDWLAVEEHPYKLAAFDAMGGFERLCHEEVCRRDYRGEWGDKGFGSYQKGFDTALTDWLLMLTSLDRLRNERGMSIVMLAHSKVKTFKNPEGQDFDQYTTDINPKTWELTHKWADMVLFLNYVTIVDKDGKAQGGQERLMFTENHPAFVAKNRMGLPPTIDMGNSGAEAWANLTSALKAAKGKDGG